MDRWIGKVALVTGASSGIGAAIAENLVKDGLIVIAAARRLDRLEALSEKLKGLKGKLISLQMDLANEESIRNGFERIRKDFNSLSILVNNAAALRFGFITDQPFEHLKETIDVNLTGLALCTQLAVKIMEEEKIEEGYIVNINSDFGHGVLPFSEPMMSIYPSTKFGVTALTEQLRQEMRFKRLNIRTTSISPGYVKTELMDPALIVQGSKKKKNIYENSPYLTPTDISDVVSYVLSTPLDVNISEVRIKPTGSYF